MPRDRRTAIKRRWRTEVTAVDCAQRIRQERERVERARRDARVERPRPVPLYRLWMEQSEWLVPQPSATVPASGLRRPDGSLDEEAMAVLVTTSADELAISLPAFADDGTALPPPDRHVLDYLARANDLVDENTQIEHPISAGTACVVIGELPRCDYCEASARYDHVVATVQGEVGAFLCVEHARPLVTRLGAPDGTVYLLTSVEVSPRLQRRVDDRLRELGRA